MTMVPTGVAGGAQWRKNVASGQQPFPPSPTTPPLPSPNDLEAMGAVGGTGGKGVKGEGQGQRYPEGGGVIRSGLGVPSGFFQPQASILMNGSKRGEGGGIVVQLVGPLAAEG